MATNPICKRCNRRSVRREVIDKNEEFRAELQGAISRSDNETEICSACGFDEALLDYDGTGHQPVSEWPVKPKYHEVYDDMMQQIPRD